MIGRLKQMNLKIFEHVDNGQSYILTICFFSFSSFAIPIIGLTRVVQTTYNSLKRRKSAVSLSHLFIVTDISLNSFHFYQDLLMRLGLLDVHFRRS